MAYQVNRFNGTFLVSVADGTIDSSTNLRFLGKNYAGYGQVQNENFLHLLENFSGATSPSKPIVGQLWFDTVDRKIKVFDGIRFKLVGGSVSSNSPPSGLADGEFWFDKLAQQLYCWNGSEFSLIGPENPSALGETSIVSQVVKDELGTNHSIAKVRSGGQTIAVISKDTFNLNLSLLAGSSDLAGFGRIKKGITLADTNNDDGVTSKTSGTVFWGTAQTANNLVDAQGTLFPVSRLVRTDLPLFESPVTFSAGFSLGSISDPKITITVSNNNKPELISQTGESFGFNVRSTGQVRRIVNIGISGIEPEVTSTYSLGTESKKWFQIYADNISANLVGNVLGNTTGTHFGNIVASDNSIIVNTTSKTIVANRIEGQFQGELAGNATSSDNAIRLNGLLPNVGVTPNTVVVRTPTGDVQASNFIGTASLSNRLKIDNSADDSADAFYKTAKTNKSPLSIAARDSAGNLSANIFNGTATAVQGADLAEKYIPDQDYDVGTVVAVGGEKEITACKFGNRPIGVISANPGVKMNSELETGVYVALKGRVPVKVSGKVNKGDRLVAGANGTATIAVFHQYSDVFAIALDSIDEPGVNLIEAVIL
jgi:hypothetical protein